MSDQTHDERSQAVHLMMRSHDERSRAVQLMERRYQDARGQVLPDCLRIDERLDLAVAIAERAILSGDLLDSASDVRSERQRAVGIMKNTFFGALDLVEEDGESVDERLSEAINGAERDILGEYAPSELWQDPGAAAEVARSLVISTESRRTTDGFESRWICGTCQTHGAWIANVGFRHLHHEHAEEHALGMTS